MASIEVKRFDAPDETRPFEGHGKMDVVKVGGRTVGRGTFEPGWRWSENVKPIAGTDSCQVVAPRLLRLGPHARPHGRRQRREIGPGDVVAIPPGHDAEVVGDEACVMLDFGEIGEYAKRH